MSVYDCGREQRQAENPPLKKPDKRNGILGGIDRDTLLTAAVMLLMLRNGGDMRLILALGYIIAGGFGKNDSK